MKHPTTRSSGFAIPRLAAACVGLWFALCHCNNTPGGGATDAGTDVDRGDTDDASAPLDADPTLLPDGAANPCLGATGCEDCTARSPCGWCNGQCLSGEAAGSYDQTCSGAPWQYYGDQCPGPAMAACPMHTDCSSCAMDENGCGWCANSHQCSSGGAHGPSGAIAGCSPDAGTWVYNTTVMACP